MTDYSLSEDTGKHHGALEQAGGSCAGLYTTPY